MIEGPGLCLLQHAFAEPDGIDVESVAHVGHNQEVGG
jgi:hypothetical protein